MGEARVTLTLACLLVAAGTHAQGFVNMSFEAANVAGYTPGYVPTSAAFPGWAAYYGTSNNPTAAGAVPAYDTVPLGGAAIILVDSNGPSGGTPPPLQGTYSAFLEGSSLAAASSASLGQTGTVPTNAQSLVFWGMVSPGVQISFGGQSLSYLITASTPNYNTYEADISAFAGQTGQLLFTAPVQGGALLDNIQFSSSAIPEPSTFAFFGLGIVLLCRRVIKSRR